MKNKTVIRKENVKGQFTTVHHSILKDKRLSPNGFRLLVNILSDSDENFKLSPTVYCNRLGITKTTFLNAVINLENCGYLKRAVSKVNKRKKHYTVSEFGNLKKEQSESDINESENPIEHEEASLENVTEYSDEFLDYVNTLIKLFKYEEFESLFNDEWIEKLKINTVVELKKHVDAYLVGIYKEYLALAKNPEKHPKALKDYKDLLKKEIYIAISSHLC